MNTNTTTTNAAGATSPATIEHHTNHITGKGIDYTAQCWYVREAGGKLHGQFMTEDEAASFASTIAAN